MDQDQHLLGPLEPVTESEVRALVERFGERQSMAHNDPRVQDVAEALNVDPATVGRMLHEIRGAADTLEVNQRLNRLEMENAELRDRTSISGAFHAPFPDARVRVPFLLATAISIFVVLVATEGFGLGAHSWSKQFAAVVLLFVLLFPPLYLIVRSLVNLREKPRS